MAKNYNCASVTGLTLARNQAKFGNERIEKNVSIGKAYVLLLLSSVLCVGWRPDAP